MRFRQRYQPIQAFAAKRADQPLANGIRLWTSGRGLEDRDPEFGDGVVQMLGENAVSIVEQILVTRIWTDSLSELLQSP